MDRIADSPIGFEPTFFDVAPCIGTILTGVVMREILKNSLVDLPQMRGIECAADRVELQFDNSRIADFALVARARIGH
ncbi:hypothetical protein ASE69_20915 [Sphingomonas sp. Leaf208]|nr:hypothetical protein ASE69_20915 [Sphingomonas sp. Leaf208]